MAMACKFFDIDLEVYMVKVSYHQKPYRRIIMENFGAQVYPSPSDHTHTGQAALAADPNSPGSLGLATAALAFRCKCGAGRRVPRLRPTPSCTRTRPPARPARPAPAPQLGQMLSPSSRPVARA